MRTYNASCTQISASSLFTYTGAQVKTIMQGKNILRLRYRCVWRFSLRDNASCIVQWIIFFHSHLILFLFLWRKTIEDEWVPTRDTTVAPTAQIPRISVSSSVVRDIENQDFRYLYPIQPANSIASPMLIVAASRGAEMKDREEKKRNRKEQEEDSEEEDQPKKKKRYLIYRVGDTYGCACTVIRWLKSSLAVI